MPRVLVIDEDPAFASELRAALDGSAVVHTAADISSGFVLLYSNFYDALVIDPISGNDAEGDGALHFLLYMRDARHQMPIVLVTEVPEVVEKRLGEAFPNVTLCAGKDGGRAVRSLAAAVLDLARNHASEYS